MTLDGADASATLPADVAGVELGALQPDASSFCEAAATAPTRWITDAVVPLQFWIDSFADLPDVPEPAADAVRRLREFADERMRWQFGQRQERPIWDEVEIADALALAESAIASCQELPLVVGPPGVSVTPLAWEDLDPTSIADLCDSDRLRVEAAIEEFATAFGRQPRHQIEMEPAVARFYASDWHGVTVNPEGQAVVIPVPNGACDLR